MTGQQMEIRLARLERAYEQIDSRLADLRQDMDRKFAAIDQRFAGIDQRFASVEQRFAGIDQKTDLDRRPHRCDLDDNDSNRFIHR